MALMVYFDGSCHLCSREIEHYRKHKRAPGRLEFIDISSSSFDPQKEGLSKEDFERAMHVRLSDGSFVVGVEAFVAIWKELRIFKLLTLLAEVSFSRFFMDMGYKIFARIRVYLPKRDCHDGNCKR